MNITKRESAYRVRVFNGKDADGKFLYSSMTIRFDDPRFEGMTEKSVTRRLKRLALNLNSRSIHLPYCPLSRSEPLRRSGLRYADIQQPTTTRERCEDFKERTYAAIGDMRMDKIKTIHIQDFINSLTKPGVNKTDPEKGLSYKTIKHYRSFISEVFDYANCCPFGILNTLGIYTHAFNEVKARVTDEIVDMLHINEKYCRQA